MKDIDYLRVTIKATRITAIPKFIYFNQDGEELSPWRTKKKAATDKANLMRTRTSNDLSLQSRRKISDRLAFMAYAATKKRGTKQRQDGTFSQYWWKVGFAVLTIQSGWHENSEMFVPATDPVFFRKVDYFGKLIWIRDHSTQQTQERMADLDSTLFQRRLLNPFLTYARKYWGLKNYTWKLERTISDTIHCHFIPDVFIPKEELQRAWNRYLKRGGLLERYAEWSRGEYGHKRTEEQHYNPPSTRIEVCKSKDSNPAEYLCKEFVGKKYIGRFIKGRIWSCNRALGRMDKLVVKLPWNEKTADREDCMESNRVMQALQKLKKKKFIEREVDGKTITVGQNFFPERREWANKKLGIVRETFLNALYALRTGGFAPGLFFPEPEKSVPISLPVIETMPKYSQSKMQLA